MAAVSVMGAWVDEQRYVDAGRRTSKGNGMTALLMTGFPGFLGSSLLPRLLARRDRIKAVCVVQSQHLATATERLRAIEAEHPEIAGRTELLTGDITQAGLGIDAAHAPILDEVTEVWHLAAVYDLAVAERIARRVNVEGTAHVLTFCRERPALQRLQYVSTCYVSGRAGGRFTEDMLDVGQTFNNHYEATKFEAERLVRDAMAAGLPATIYRPGIVVGDSRSGETQKYDGPYYIARFLRRQPLPVAMLPAVHRRYTTSLVPRDFVIDAMDRLSVLDVSLGRTYALTDPTPPTNRQVAETFARHLGKRLVWVPLPLGVTKATLTTVPGLERLLGLPAELLDYFAASTTYATDHTLEDLAGTGVACPPFESYAGSLLDFMERHPEIDASAMV
jgi:nucleoside-diphosphate-sugar epimerase